MSKHSAEVVGNIHISYNWSYANAGLRTGATGFVNADKGKFARQTDNNSIWMLTATTPTWLAVGGNGNGFPSCTLFADQLIHPVNADWPVTILAPLATDSNDARLQVVRFNDTTPWGTGIPIVAPADALNISLTLRSRAETAPGAARTVGIKIYNCGIPDNAAVEAWDAGTVLTDIDIPTNEYFQYDTQVISFATLGITAGEETLLELTRIAPVAGVNLVDDWNLRSVTVEFS